MRAALVWAWAVAFCSNSASRFCWVNAQVVMPTIAESSMAPTPKASVMRVRRPRRGRSRGRSSK
jgi:hypothetical protein